MSLSDNELKKIDPIKNLTNRLTWNEYYLSLAFLISLRSFDPSSKCGCVIVDQNNRILATGYNGPIKQSVDEHIPLTRPERYHHMIHAEENALLSYFGSYQDIQNSTIYITTRPCSKCLRGLIQKGITNIIYTMNTTWIVDKNDIDAQTIMLENRNIKIQEISHIDYSNILKKAFTEFEKIISILGKLS